MNLYLVILGFLFIGIKSIDPNKEKTLFTEHTDIFYNGYIVARCKINTHIKKNYQRNVPKYRKYSCLKSKLPSNIQISFPGYFLIMTFFNHYLEFL